MNPPSSSGPSGLASDPSDLAEDLPYWVAFSRVPQVGRVRFGMLEERFGSLQAAWQASEGELVTCGLGQNAVASIAKVRSVTDPLAEVERLQRAGVTILTWHDPEYPRRLLETDDPPPVIYVKGTLLPDDERSVTVVGTRRPTAYGKEAARHLAGDLAKAGVTVVSGLARGIDGVAHRAALEEGGRTIAVMGSGMDVVYPPEHLALAGEIAGSGAVLTEHPLGVKPEAQHFPRRNRLLSGLSLGTLVIEAGEGSGALSTVRFALEQGREVFVGPESIYSPASTLTNRLAQEGAKIVTGVEDVLEELNLSPVSASQPRLDSLLTEGTDDGAGLLPLLGFEPQHIDDISRRAGISVTRVSGALAIMEMNGQVRQVGRMNYILSRSAPAASQ